MLILTRKTGQGFRIGDDIEITITEISGDKVRVGINAPKDIKILRSELSETMQQNVQAAQGVGSDALRALARSLKKEQGALKAVIPQQPEDKKEPSAKPEAADGEETGKK